MIPSPNKFHGNQKWKIHICVGVWLGGYPATKFSHRSKNATTLMLIYRARIDAEKRYMYSAKNDPKTCRFESQLVGNIILNIFVNFHPKTPTQISTTHAFLKIRTNFQNQIPREMDKNFDIPRISTIHWIISNFLK